MDLIKLSSTNTQFPVDSRDLHAFMSVASHHRDWVARRISDFIDEEDYCSILSGHEKVFMLSLGVAKHFSMMERTEKGKVARQWFIEREKTVSKPMDQFELAIWSANLLNNHDKQLKEQALQLTEQAQDIANLKGQASIGYLVRPLYNSKSIHILPAGRKYLFNGAYSRPIL